MVRGCEGVHAKVVLFNSSFVGSPGSDLCYFGIGWFRKITDLGKRKMTWWPGR